MRSVFYFISMLSVLLSLSSCHKTKANKAQNTKTTTQDAKTPSAQENATPSLEEFTLNSDTHPAPGSSNTSPSTTAEVSSTPASEKAQVATEDASISSDHNEIKNKTNLKLSFKDLQQIKLIAADTKSVLYSGKLITAEEASKKLVTANEENFCAITISGKFNSKDLLELEGHERTQTDKVNDIFKTELKFKNSNGSITFSCNHTTDNYFIEDFALNFKEILTVYTMDGPEVDLNGYVNTRTLNRRMNAITLKDIASLQKIILDDSANLGYALGNGKIDIVDKMIVEVENGKLPMACMIGDIKGDLDPKKIYIRVSKGISEKNQSEASIQAYTTYRADADTYFTLSCRMSKTAPWSEILNMAQGIFNFEALQRRDYNKKYDEMFSLHQSLTAKP